MDLFGTKKRKRNKLKIKVQTAKMNLARKRGSDDVPTLAERYYGGFF